MPREEFERSLLELVCPLGEGEKDEICVAEPEEYLSADVQYVWDVRHYDDKSPVNFETDRYDMYPWWGYTDMHTLCRGTGKRIYSSFRQLPRAVQCGSVKIESDHSDTHI